MGKLIKLFLASAIIATFSFAENKEYKPQVFQVKTLDANKTLTVTEAKNGLVFKDFKGKVVLLEFWGTHCPPCLMSIPHYKKITNEYKDKVAMVAIEVQSTPREQLKKFVESKGINYYVGTLKENGYFVDYVAKRAGWRGAIPFLIILDTNGNVIDMKRGFASEEYVKSVITYALDKANSNTTTNNTKKVENNNSSVKTDTKPTTTTTTEKK